MCWIIDELYERGKLPTVRPTNRQTGTRIDLREPPYRRQSTEQQTLRDTTVSVGLIPTSQKDAVRKTKCIAFAVSRVLFLDRTRPWQECWKSVDPRIVVTYTHTDGRTEMLVTISPGLAYRRAVGIIIHGISGKQSIKYFRKKDHIKIGFFWSQLGCMSRPFSSVILSVKTLSCLKTVLRQFSRCLVLGLESNWCLGLGLASFVLEFTHTSTTAGVPKMT